MHCSSAKHILPAVLLAIGTTHADPVIFIKNISNRDVFVAPFDRSNNWLTKQFIKPKGEYKDENLGADDIKGVHIKYCPQGISCSSLDAMDKSGGSAVEFEFHDPSATKFYLKLDIDKNNNVTLKRQEGRLGRTSNLKWSLDGNIIQDAIIRTTIAPTVPSEAPTPPSLGMTAELMRIIGQEDVYITTLQDMTNGKMPLDESLLKDSGFQEIIDKPMAEFRKKYGANTTFNEREKNLIDTHTTNYQKASNLLSEARKLAQKQKIRTPPSDMPPALPTVESLLSQLKQEYEKLEASVIGKQLTEDAKNQAQKQLIILSNNYSDIAVRFNKNHTYTPREIVLQKEIEDLNTKLKDILKEG
jgi:hypothetical protein